MSATESKVETRDITDKIKLISDSSDPRAQEVIEAIAQAELGDIDTNDITVFITSITPSTSRLGINAVTNGLWNTNGVVKMVLVNNGHQKEEIKRMDNAASWRLRNDQEGRYVFIDFERPNFAEKIRFAVTSLTQPFPGSDSKQPHNI